MSDEVTKSILERAQQLRKEWERHGKSRADLLREFRLMLIGDSDPPKSNAGAGTVELKFDTPQALGYVGLRKTAHGAELMLNGRVIAFLDLFPPTEGEAPQLIIDSQDNDCDDPIAKIVLAKTMSVVVVSSQLSSSLLMSELYSLSGKADYVFHQPNK